VLIIRRTASAAKAYRSEGRLEQSIIQATVRDGAVTMKHAHLSDTTNRLSRLLLICAIAGTSSVALTPAIGQTPVANPADVVAKTPINPAPAAPAQPQSEDTVRNLLSIGDKAPALDVESWVKGTPVTGFEPGKVYVVEFWATWCGPCIRAFPHLSKLQAKYKDQGVTLIGVNIWERPYDASTKGKVEAFVEKQGERMAYTVAYDGVAAKTNTAYMKAANQNGIPHAFIVNQEGLIAWAGHPAGMDDPLAQIVAKTWDINAAKAAEIKERAEEAEADRKAKEMSAKISPIQARLTEATKAKNWADATKALDEMVELMPAPQAGRVIHRKFFMLLRDADLPDQAYAMKDTLLTHAATKDNASLLNDVAFRVLSDPRVKTRNPAFALQIATRASALTKDNDPNILDTLALAHFENGDKPKAVEVATKALELAKANPDRVDNIKDFEEALKKYQGQ
jgi:thiol-disulfide isomerase/thioredoxin